MMILLNHQRDRKNSLEREIKNMMNYSKLLKEKENNMKESLKNLLSDNDNKELIIEYIIKLNNEYNYSKNDILELLK